MVRVLQELSALDGGGVAKLLYDYYRNMDHTKIHFDFLIYGCDVKLINYIREDSLDKNLLHTWCGSNPVKQIAMLPTLMKWKSVFNKFITQHFDLTEHVSK